jgi:hypothetical protein
MHAGVALGLDERFDGGRQFIGDAADPAILVEIAIVVGGMLAVAQRRVGIGGAVNRGAAGHLQAIETLVEAEGAAERGVDRIRRKPRLDVGAAGVVGRQPQAQLRGEVDVPGNVEAAVDMARKIGPVGIGRRRRRRAVERRRQAAAIAGEGPAEVCDQRVTVPVGHRKKLRRDHIERQAVLLGKAAGIAVVAAGQFDRRLDQEAAGIIADRAERVVVELEPPARRLAGHGVRHRGRDRRPVGGIGGRNGKAQFADRIHRRWLLRRRAGPRRRLRPGLRGIIFRRLALAVERIEARVARAVRGWEPIGRDLADPRRRRHVAVARRIAVALTCIAIGIARRTIGRGLADRARRQVLGCDEAATGRVEEAWGQRLGARGGLIQGDQRKAWQKRAEERRAPFVALDWTRHQDRNTPTNS